MHCVHKTENPGVGGWGNRSKRCAKFTGDTAISTRLALVLD